MIQFDQKGQPFTVRVNILSFSIFFLTINRQRQAIYEYFSFCTYFFNKSQHPCLEIFVNFTIITENVNDALISGSSVIIK
jgi:hypothetical protein